MTDLHVAVTKQLKEQLRILAFQKKVTMGVIVREALQLTIDANIAGEKLNK